MRFKFLLLSALTCLSVAACDDAKNNDLPFTRVDGTVTDSTGKTCKVDNGTWADCYQETYKSSCKDGKAVVCGNLYTRFEVFEVPCNCQMIDGKATCGECTPGELNAGKTALCSPAGQWEDITLTTNHPEEMNACDPATYKAKCDKGIALECWDIDSRVHAVDCNANYRYGRIDSCVEVDNALEEEEFNQYTLKCEDVTHRAYCAACTPGEEAEAGTICIDSSSLNGAAVKCSEYGFWVDKATGGIPQYTPCKGACTEGKCLGEYVQCTPERVADHVCYTEDSFVYDTVKCMITGERWAEDRDKSLHIEYCPKGCKDDVCLK